MKINMTPMLGTFITSLIENPQDHGTWMAFCDYAHDNSRHLGARLGQLLRWGMGRHLSYQFALELLLSELETHLCDICCPRLPVDWQCQMCHGRRFLEGFKGLMPDQMCWLLFHCGEFLVQEKRLQMFIVSQEKAVEIPELTFDSKQGVFHGRMPGIPNSTFDKDLTVILVEKDHGLVGRKIAYSRDGEAEDDSYTEVLFNVGFYREAPMEEASSTGD